MLHSYFSDGGWFAFMVYIINLLILKKELLIASLCLVVACVVITTTFRFGSVVIPPPLPPSLPPFSPEYSFPCVIKSQTQNIWSTRKWQHTVSTQRHDDIPFIHLTQAKSKSYGVHVQFVHIATSYTQKNIYIVMLAIRKEG